ncbi:hypothetical protein MSAN_00079400 [Mycena sanguinolenta]|uniref:Uncharacterized protein n=1 Tax=Mycena sanguinolenta TaxID=230812 RepID=A0A8H6ZHX9_9AGAR|nr:hypothetical protein MSAN_00079400 [Mycena sanguinolenta]
MNIPFLVQLGILYAPNLTSFSVVGGKMNALHLPLRWHQLTNLSFDGTFNVRTAQAPETILIVLSRCPQLRTVHFLIHDSVQSQLSDTVVQCSFLHTVKLYCLDNPLHTADRLLSRLWLPDLRNFKLGGFYCRHAHTIESAEFLLSSLANYTRLESISIDSVLFSKVELAHFLLGLPSPVLRLEIAEPLPVPGRPTFPGHDTLDDGVMEVLDASFEGPTPCPALEELVITTCRAVSDKALLRFVKARLPTLRYVHVAFERERQFEILPELEQLIEVGDLKISLTYVTFPAPSFSPWEGLADGPPPSLWTDSIDSRSYLA